VRNCAQNATKNNKKQHIFRTVNGEKTDVIAFFITWNTKNELVSRFRTGGFLMACSCHVYSVFPSKTGKKTCHKPAMNLPFGCHSAGEFRKITRWFQVHHQVSVSHL